MLQAVVTMIFLGAGMFSLAVITAMLMDHDREIAQALGLVQPLSLMPLPTAPSRVRVVRSPRMMPMSPLLSPVPLREAA